MSRHKTPEEYQSTNLGRLRNLRSLLFTEIERELEEGGSIHPHEGIFKLKFPSVFGTEYRVSLHTYLLKDPGQGGNHKWTGRTLDEAVARAEKDVKHWIEERKR